VGPRAERKNNLPLSEIQPRSPSRPVRKNYTELPQLQQRAQKKHKRIASSILVGSHKWRHLSVNLGVEERIILTQPDK
jgi:hypothetical protein